MKPRWSGNCISGKFRFFQNFKSQTLNFNFRSFCKFRKFCRQKNQISSEKSKFRYKNSNFVIPNILLAQIFRVSKIPKKFTGTWRAPSCIAAMFSPRTVFFKKTFLKFSIFQKPDISCFQKHFLLLKK